MKYRKDIFNPVNLEHAKAIVLQPDPARPDKFVEETEYLVDFIEANTPLSETSLVLDFGCGMGRIAKRLIEKVGCKVIGIDISSAMMAQAQRYVTDVRFEPKFEYNKTDIDIIVASLVLQHVEDPKRELQKLDAVLKPGGYFVLLNEPDRYVPVDIDGGTVQWHDDGIRIDELMKEHFELVGYCTYPGRSDTPLSLWQKSSQ